MFDHVFDKVFPAFIWISPWLGKLLPPSGTIPKSIALTFKQIFLGHNQSPCSSLLHSWFCLLEPYRTSLTLCYGHLSHTLEGSYHDLWLFFRPNSLRILFFNSYLFSTVSNNFITLVGLLLLNKLCCSYKSHSPSFSFPLPFFLSLSLSHTNLWIRLDLPCARHFAKWWGSNNQPYLIRAVYCKTTNL